MVARATQAADSLQTLVRLSSESTFSWLAIVPAGLMLR